MTVWLEWQTAALVDGWGRGLTGSEIAALVGKSRGAVSGKRNWMGLPARTGEVGREAQRLNGLRRKLLRQRANALRIGGNAENGGRDGQQCAARSGDEPAKLGLPEPEQRQQGSGPQAERGRPKLHQGEQPQVRLAHA